MSAPTLKNAARRAGPKEFPAGRAQKWILASALITAVIYAFRRTVEPASQAQPRGGQAARLIGAGSPPVSLERWAVSYSAAFLMLSILALGAPELAASLAAMVVLANLLANGTTIASDLARLEGQPHPKTITARSLPSAVAPATAQQVNQATGAAP